MKIKLSKNQWERIGRVAGWVKKASNKERLIYLPEDPSYFTTENSPQKLSKDGFTEAWEIIYLSGEEAYNSDFDGLSQYRILQRILISAMEIFSGESVVGGEDIIKRLNITQSDVDDLFALMGQNHQELEEQRANERSEMRYEDDQRPGAYEEYGPDPQPPQY